MKILSATDFSIRSYRAVRRAGLLARQTGAELTLVHVVDDDQPESKIAIETREAERILREQIGSVPELDGVVCHSAVVPGDPFDGILRSAEAVEADLIVMGAHRKHLLRDIFVGTTIERVIRRGAYPVLMVNGEAVAPYRSAVAGVDMSEPSAHALRTAERLGVTAGTRLTLLHAFDPWAKGRMALAGLPESAIHDHVNTERRRSLEELGVFLKAGGFEGRDWVQRAEDGAPFEVISRAVKTMKPDLLVLGTHGRSGLVKVLLGSVTEEALRSLDLDVLAVPVAS